MSYDSVKQNLGYLIAGAVVFSALIAVVFEVYSAPNVKKSRFEICHSFESFYYRQTTNYTPYTSMQECIESGGREP